MTGSEFVATYANKGVKAWEAAMLDLAKRGGLVEWPLVPITVTDGTHTLTYFVTSDYFAVGTPSDFVRVGLTPHVGQQLLDVWGMYFPTTAMVKQIHDQAAQSGTVIAPITSNELTPPQPNKNQNLQQYAEQDAKANVALSAAGGELGKLVSGVKKDIVTGKALKPHNVVIYGWFKKSVPGVDPTPMMGPNDLKWQPYYGGHDDGHVDYSHGVRGVSPHAKLDGKDVEISAILQDPTLAKLVSWEGALTPAQIRYSTPDRPTPTEYYSNMHLDDRGLEVIRTYAREKRV